MSIVDCLVDEKVGIVKHVGCVPREVGAPDFFHYAAEGCDAKAFNSHGNSRIGGGASYDRDIALAKAIGEVVERYSSAIYEIDDFPLTTARRATFPCVEPSRFALYSEGQYHNPQFPYAKFDSDTLVRWAPCQDFLTQETSFVPAAMVLMPYRYSTGETHIVQPISTGLACHTSFEKAANAAVCEVIERDAFTIVWQARIAPPRVNLATLSDLNRNLIRRFEVTQHAVSIFYITLDHQVPVILSVLSNSSHEVPALVFAAAADCDPNVAVRKSLEELAHTRRLAVYLKETTPPVPAIPPFDSVHSQDSHVRLYCDQENAHLADFLFSNNHSISLQEISCRGKGNSKEDLQMLLENIKDVGHQVLLADLTSPDLRCLGLSVVRAVIPGFHPLFMGHARRALGGNRLWSLPQKLKLNGIDPCNGDNPAPHPYP